MYRASVGITTNMKPKATGWIASNAERLGIEGIWIGEDIDLGQDVFVLTAATLIQASKTRVGTAIIPVAVHSIKTLARAAVTLYQTGGGRFVFGTGIGGIQDLKSLGISLTKPVSELRKAISVLRKLWAGEAVTVESELGQLKDFDLGLKKPFQIPVFLGVRGPQMLKLTGQVADGVILSGPFDYLKDAVRRVDKAAENSGRSAKDIEKVAWLPTIPSFEGSDEGLAKRVVALVVADMPLQVVDMLDVDTQRVTQIREAVAKSGPSAGIPFVNQEIIDMFSISGEIAYMVDRFETLARMGLTEVVLGPPFSGNWRGTMTEVFQEIKRRR
ncbi:MAG: LLM class flavin-dependent oxidoreductase [Candidatus Thorarchaeota archaeon]|nr:MAG: LLM class flavin-dependent oxidoreductase [Candidatus Thorarchaeota archaeon]